MVSMRLHEIPTSQSHSGDTFLALQFTQRVINRDYRIETGKYSDSEYPPELDECTKASKVPLYNRYHHLVCPPFTAITSKQRSLIESMRSLSCSTVIAFHACLTASRSAS